MRAGKLLLITVGLPGMMSISFLGGVDRASAQELLCPQTGIPMSQDPGCTTPNYGNQGNAEAPNTRPIPPGMDPRNLPPPDPNVEGLWGSLAVAPDHRIFWSYGRRDRQSAEQTALDSCRSSQTANMDGCRILNTGQTVDVALAFDGATYFIGRVPGYDKAMKKALKACQAGPQPGQCRISLLYSPVGGPLPDDVAKVVYGL